MTHDDPVTGPDFTQSTPELDGCIRRAARAKMLAHRAVCDAEAAMNTAKSETIWNAAASQIDFKHMADRLEYGDRHSTIHLRYAAEIAHCCADMVERYSRRAERARVQADREIRIATEDLQVLGETDILASLAREFNLVNDTAAKAAEAAVESRQTAAMALAAAEDALRNAAPDKKKEVPVPA